MTTTIPAWLNLDELCPQEMREEGLRLLDAVRDVREALTPLVPQVARLIEASNRQARAAVDDVARVAGPDAAHEISNGLGQLVGTLTSADQLYSEMTALGLDEPWDLPKAADR